VRLLALDSSTERLSLALWKGDKILKARSTILHRTLSSRIIPCIDRLLKEEHLSLGHLDGFAVGLGPGSFTSLRVGLATVKALAFYSGKPLLGISSLDVLAMGVRAGEGARIATVCDARRGLVYACLYERNKGTIKRKSPYLLTELSSWLKDLQGEVEVVGDGADLFQETILKRKDLGSRIHIHRLHHRPRSPQARDLARLALERLEKGKTDHADKIVPLYLYPQDCQVRR